MLFHEPTRAQHLNTSISGDVEKVSITTHDQPATIRKCAGDEFVVVRVITDLLRKRLRMTDQSRFSQQGQKGKQIYSRELNRKLMANSLIFSKDVRKEYDADFPVSPGLKDSVRWPGKEHPGDEHIGVNDDLHRRLRVSATIRATSVRFIPARRACLRAVVMSSSKSSSDGAVIALRITTSPSPTTMN